jgi:hypothetical protein
MSVTVDANLRVRQERTVSAQQASMTAQRADWIRWIAHVIGHAAAEASGRSRLRDSHALARSTVLRHSHALR